MAITALSKVNPFWFIPDAEKDEDKPTRFRLKPLSPAEYEACMQITEGGSLQIPPSSYDTVLRYGLVDWDNFADPDGSAVKFSRVNFSRLPSVVRIELAGEILAASMLTEDEVKN